MRAPPVRFRRAQLSQPEMLSRVGKYEVKQLLGKGATGSVYLAADPFGQRDVALKFANTLGVVHRDIKPANILTRGIDEGSLDIKVSDFGAAQLARSDVTQVSGVGSPAYMSPEQVKGEEIDFRSDMFSVGGVLYHLLTGHRPFDGAN